MQGAPAITKYAVTMASGATLTAELDLGSYFTNLYLDCTGAASEIRLQAAAAAGGTYRQVYHPSINSSTVGVNIFKISSAASGGFVPIPAGIRFLKVETTATVSNGLTFTIIAGG